MGRAQWQGSGQRSRLNFWLLLQAGLVEAPVRDPRKQLQTEAVSLPAPPEQQKLKVVPVASLLPGPADGAVKEMANPWQLLWLPPQHWIAREGGKEGGEGREGAQLLPGSYSGGSKQYRWRREDILHVLR